MKIHLTLVTLLAAISVAAFAETPGVEDKTSTQAGGDRAGNGGNFIEMKVVNTAYKSLEMMQKLKKQGKLPVDVDLFSLETKLKYITVRVAPDLELEGYRKSMINYPAQNLVLISEPQFQKNQDKPTELLQLVTHEILPLVGVADKSYQNSTAIMKNIATLKDDSDDPSQGPAPQLLYSEETDSDRHGLDFESASRICGLQKQIYQEDFYFVYCVYIEKTKEHVVPVVYDDSEFERIFDPITGEVRTIERRHVTTTERVLRESVYGLRVFGLGKSTELPWKTLFSSLKMFDGTLSLTYPTDREAYRSCRESLREKDEDGNNFRYYRAKCRTPKGDDGKYYFEIITQNPFVPGISN